MSETAVGVRCGQCGSPILMATCDLFHGTGHEWVIVSVCPACRLVHWTKDGCLDCGASGRRAGGGAVTGSPVWPILRETAYSASGLFCL